MVAAEPTVLACRAVMVSAIGANNVLCLANAPTRFNDCVSASLFVVEVERHCKEGVKLGEVYHNQPIISGLHYIIGEKVGFFNLTGTKSI